MKNRSVLLCFVAMSALGCAGPSKAPVAQTTPSGTAEAVPEGSKVVCHLDCSGKQEKAYGPTEEEARANVRQFVSKICNPDDGQYFIFCEPIK